MTKTAEKEKIKWRSEIFKEHLRKVGFRLPLSEDYYAGIGEKIIIIAKKPDYKNN